MNNTLADYGSVLRSRWRWPQWGVILAMALTTVALLASPPLYRTDAKVFVRTPGDVSRVLDGGDTYAQARARTYAALASSTSVSARVIADLGLALKPETLSKRIEASNPPGTALIDVRVSAPTGEQAQRIATVLLAECSATVHILESVPGSVVPRAELIVVDPPGPPVRVVAWGLPISAFLLGVVLIGLFLGATAGVLYEMLGGPTARPFSQPVVVVRTTGAVSECLPKADPFEGDK
jgi:capsular polysaccharide biosynthesis protein